MFHKFNSLREIHCRSKPQEELFEILLRFFPDAELEYKIGGRKNKVGYHIRYADIGIPSLKIDFEYDGSYSHQNTSFADERRDEELSIQGWRTIRINSQKLSILKSLVGLTKERFCKEFKIEDKKDDTKTTTN